jgi:hypothetical protein
VKALAAAAVATAVVLVPVDADGSMSKGAWVAAVVAHTDLTPVQARGLWRRRPSWRDELPVAHEWTSWATPVPSPAGVSGISWCTVTTVEKYRAPLFPFGDQVLFSFGMERSFGYDGSTVAPGTAFFDADTTGWGWRWSFGGVIAQPQGFLDDRRFTHRTDGYGAFQTEGIGVLRIGAVHATLHDRIVFSADGDWSTMNDEGSPGCRN